MTLTLKNREARRLIEERVKSGRYRSAEHVITAALFCLEQQEREIEFEPGELEALVAVGLAEDSRGETLDGEEVFRELDRLRKRAMWKVRKAAKPRSPRTPRQPH